jgi:hypothetical protein
MSTAANMVLIVIRKQTISNLIFLRRFSKLGVRVKFQMWLIVPYWRPGLRPQLDLVLRHLTFELAPLLYIRHAVTVLTLSY